MIRSFLSNLMKRKRIEDEDDVFLRVNVQCADGIDHDNMGPGGNTRRYQVFGWVRPGSEFITKEVLGWPDPSWRVIFTVPLGRNATGKCLHLEVVRTGSMSGPGTSSGDVVVGRIQIPLPEEFYVKKGGQYSLVRHMEEKIVIDGHINIVMEMIEAEYFHHFYCHQ